MVGTTWLQAVSDELARCYRPGQEFELTDFYRRAEDRLQAMYPDNTRVQDTMRNIMQKLRNSGLLTFHGRGRYTYNGSVGGPRKTTAPRGDVAQAAYDLASRVTDETRIPASDYLAIARAADPVGALAELLLDGHAGPTFRALNRAGRLDLSIERLTIEFAGPLALGTDLVSAAADRLAYYESDEG